MKDAHQTITDRILANVDDAGEWKPCWTGMQAGVPINGTTKKRYRGVNVLSLWMEQRPSNEWASYKQWQGVGRQVARGERGTPIVFYKEMPVKDPDRKDDTYLFARLSMVFNESQLTDYEPGLKHAITEEERIVNCEQWVAARRHAFTLTHQEHKAFFTESQDRVNLPLFTTFYKPEYYYSTLFHELTHWTGAKTRLDRESLRHYHKMRAEEELVAEIGSAFLSASLGIETVTREDHLPYIARWLTHLKNDKRFITRAATQASAAFDYLDALACIQQEEAA